MDETVGGAGPPRRAREHGVDLRHTPFEEVTLNDWEDQMAVDLRAAWLCARAAVPHMRRLRGGRIINFSDWIARSGRPRYPGFLTYYVAKAGVVA